jgi:IS5 family transposase
LVRALLVKHLFGWSLRQLEFHLRFNLLVKWFVGYAIFEVGPDHATLERFEQWVCAHQTRLYFDVILRQIDADFPEMRSCPQIGDTFALRADAAKESLISLIRHTCRRLLAELQRSAPDRAQNVSTQLASTALFGLPDEADEFFLSTPERQAQLQTVVTAALRCAQLIRTQLDASSPVTGAGRVEILRWLDLLDKILADEVKFSIGGQDQQSASPTDVADLSADTPIRVAKLKKGQKGFYRLGSATDSEATYRLHGDGHSDFGYNVQIATDGIFVREIQAATGAQPDSVGIPAVLTAQRDHHDLCPEKFIYDAAGGNGKTRALVAQATDGKTQLVASLPPYDKRTERFGPERFTLSPDDLRLTCPNGKTSEVAYRSGEGDGRTFRFFPFQCKGCPLWIDCRGDKVGPNAMRQVFISDYRAEVEAARVYNQTAEFKQDMKLRPVVERIIAGLVRYNGARQAQRRGLRNADFQAKMGAAAFNLKTWLRLLAKRVRAPAVTSV